MGIALTLDIYEKASLDRGSQLASSVNSAASQITNLQTLIARMPKPNSIKEKTIVKLQETIEEALGLQFVSAPLMIPLYLV